MMLFHMRFDQESNIKDVGDSLSFPTGIYSASSDQRFRQFDFLQDNGVAETVLWTDCCGGRKMKSEADRAEFIP
jgi:hypothetical protein